MMMMYCPHTHIQGEEELCGAKVKVEPSRQQDAEQMVSRLANDLQLDHEYCLYLLRSVGHEVGPPIHASSALACSNLTLVHYTHARPGYASMG